MTDKPIKVEQSGYESFAKVSTLRTKLRVISILQKILNPGNWIAVIKYIIHNFPTILKWLVHFGIFFLIFINFFMIVLLRILMRVPIMKVIARKIFNFWTSRITEMINSFALRFEPDRKGEVNRTYLIYLAYENLKGKVTRSFVTILGMSVGVGIIVFLLSLGYGIERLIVQQVASLEELKVVDVSASENTALQIDQATLKRISKMKFIDKVIPLVSMVGRINYNRAKTDVLVYATTKEFLQASRAYPVRGKSISYTNGNYHSDIGKTGGKVAGATTRFSNAKLGDPIKEGNWLVNVLPANVATVWTDCKINSKIIGVTKRIEGGMIGQQVWGGDYAPFAEFGRLGYDPAKDQFLGAWVKATIPLFDRIDDKLVLKVGDNGFQAWETGCIQMKDMQILEKKLVGASVLGESTTTSVSAQLDNASKASESATFLYDATVVSTDSAGVEFVTLDSTESAGLKAKKAQGNIEFKKKGIGEAVVSTGLLKLLGIKINDALNTKFDVSFIIVKSLMPSIEGRAFTSQVKYQIIGVIDDNEREYFYIPINDMTELGINNLSQLKITIKDKDQLPKVRASIETIGYKTSSVVDTVAQIEKLFAGIRIVLAIVGLIALGVASLGMFNTLTVSLLERTREIGGMKTIGMVSNEILDLFLAEAMIMGFAGGIGGLTLGFLAGQVSSFLVSIVAVSQGLGYMQLTYLPISFVSFILFLSFVVGLVTGIYPALRAKQISALNALRYE